MSSVQPMQNSRSRRPHPFRWAPLVLALLLLPSAAAQPAAASQPAAALGNDLKSVIESLRIEVEASPLDSAQRETVETQIDAAATHLRDVAGLREQIASLRAVAAARTGQRDRASATRDVDPERALEEWAGRLPSDADVEMLEGMLQQQRGLVSERTGEINRIEAALAQILARPAEISSEIAALGRRIDELSSPVGAIGEEPELLYDARVLRHASELEHAETDLELRRVEQETSLARQRVRESQLHDLRWRQLLDLRRAEWLQARIAERAREELELAVARLVEPRIEQEESTEGTSTSEASLARENRNLGDELLKQNSRLEKDREEVSEEERARDRVLSALRESRTRLALGGSSEAVGRWLWSERRRLERPVRLQSQLEDRRSELAELRLRLVTLSEDQRELDDLPAAAKAMRDASQVRAADEGKSIVAAGTLEPLLRQRVELLALLEPILQRRVKALELSEQALQENYEATQSMRQLLDRYLLWTPSHAPIDSTWLDRAPEGLTDLVKPSRWATTMQLTGKELRARPVLWAGCLLFLGGLVELRRRAPAQIRAQAEPTRRIETDHIGVTLLSFGWTLAAALPLAVVFALVAELLQTAGSAGRYSDSVGRACATLVVPLLAVQMLRWAAIDGGLGDVHFGWTSARRAALRRAVARAAAIVIPMYYITSLAFIRNLELPNDVQARSAVVVACAVLAWTFWRLLDVGQVWTGPGIESEPSLLRRLLRIALPMVAFVVAVLSLAGYVYSAGLLLHALLMSICMVIAIGLGLGLLARWFLVGERRLATRRNEEQRTATGHATAEQPSDGHEADLTLEQVNTQTQRLLLVLRVSLLFFGLVWVWAEVLPAITRLDEIPLWTFSDLAADGTSIARAVTLMGALFGFVALALTIISSRNLPGLIEIGLLSQTNIDAASRYAITSILRYAIVITGTIIGLELLGMRWSQLQWMAAALTVGLGFGLQEIFANFVSGLILLFERPFRVGDVITVDTLTGRVTRIRTRATTILDYDNREIVVPNKSFITGQLLNWTLSDTTTRISIKVGVAYGTDPEKVDRLLLEAAAGNPLVQRDPEPRSWFLAFGASSLDFELRVFVGTLADRLQVQSELHREIVRLFAEHDIEIAFPQMDVHVRDLPESRSSH
jgi:potassium efflux system protein